MAEWVQVRIALRRDPKVIEIADYLSETREFMNWLADPVQRHCSESAYEHISRGATVALCVAPLVDVWGAVNEHAKIEGDDAILQSTRLITLDEIAGIPCFGDAMASVGWAVEEWPEGDEKPSVRFPKFLLRNTPKEERKKKKHASRQRRYLDNRKAKERSGGSNSGASQERHTSASKASPRGEETRGEEKRINKAPISIGEIGAKYSGLELEEIAAISDSILSRMPAGTDNDSRFAYRVAALCVRQHLARDSLEQALEAVTVNNPANPWAYLQKCLANQANDRGKDLKALLKSVRFPDLRENSPST